MKVAIYARVSTRDKQEHENQLYELRKYCNKQNYIVYKEYIDLVSGTKENRPMFKEMLNDASKRHFDLVLFWALDRFTREGVIKTLQYLQQLNDYGIDFVSYQERYINSSGIFKEAIISIMATLAQQETKRISERVKAGLETARRNGKTLGRPIVPQIKKKAVIACYEAKQTSIKKGDKSLSYREIASLNKLPKSTVMKIVKDYQLGKIDEEGFAYDKPLFDI